MKPPAALVALLGIHATIAKEAGLPSTVHCEDCGAQQEVDPAYCLAHGWPICCNKTMTLGATASEPAGDGGRPT